MASQALIHRPQTTRSATWPTDTAQVPSTLASSPNNTETFATDLDQHPETHFLSPMTISEYHSGWDSDSDSDLDSDDDGEWNAGIMDFSLFTADRKRAMATGEPLPEKWDALLSGQAEAFQRSVERVRESSGDDVLPALTPDLSPHLRDDLEEDAEVDVMPQIQVPDYLTVEVKPSPQQDRVTIASDEELPLSFYFARKRALASKPDRRIERPGLRHARTMSGRRHVWQRPTGDMWTVGEDADAEERAELEDGGEGEGERTNA